MIYRIKNYLYKVFTKNKWPRFYRKKKLMRLFERQMGYSFDIKHPQSFSEKIQWYKIYYYDDRMKIVDKYNFKLFIKERIGEQYIAKLYGAYDTIEMLKKDWENLPKCFCLKSTLQSDGNNIIIVKDKSKIILSQLLEETSSWLKPENTLINSFCNAYYRCTPKIIAEEYLHDLSEGLTDYKIYCFGGEPYCAYSAVEHFKDGVAQHSKVTFYDLNWRALPISYEGYENQPVEKPKHYEEMIRVSKELAKDFPFARVDFYDTNNQMYVGEITFYPAGGFKKFMPEKFDYELGEKFVLPKRSSCIF